MSASPHLNPKKWSVANWSRNDSGTSAIEFAFLFPLVIGLLALALTAEQGFSVKRKADFIASGLADLMSRQLDQTVTNCKIMIDAAAMSIYPYDTGTLQYAVSEIDVDGSGKATVSYSEGYNGGPLLAIGDIFHLPPNSTITNSAVMYSHVLYTWTPNVFSDLIGPVTIESEFYRNVRSGLQKRSCFKTS